MYLPSDLFELPYRNLVKTRHAASPPVVLLVALEPDALCACRILTGILKRDLITHSIIPVAGYGDLERAGLKHVQPMRLQNGGMGGHVICLGTGGMVDLAGILGLESTVEGEDAMGGVEIWVIDARRPWNLSNVFGGRPADLTSPPPADHPRKTLEVDRGRIQHNYKPGKGGVIVFDDGDVAQLTKEQEAYLELELMPDIEDDGVESDGSDSGSDDDDEPRAGQKRKSWSGAEDEDEDDDEDDRPRQRRRSNSQDSIPVTPSRHRPYNTSSDTLIPDSQPSPTGSASTLAPPSAQNADRPPSMRRMRRRLLRSKRQHESVLHAYYSRGSTYSEPISSLLYRLASDLGLANNDNLWLSCVGVQSIEQYGRLSSNPTTSNNNTLSRDELVLSLLRDEVTRLNPPDQYASLTPTSNGDPDALALPTHAKSPTDASIRLSPEPRLLLIRHWSLYESMMHSTYLAARLHLWSEPGKKRLHKLLAKMGISLANARQGYVHMDLDAKRQLRGKLLKYAPMYGLEGLLPPAGSSAGKTGWGFVRCWGWKACLSANDVGTILGAILEVGRGRPKRGRSSNGQLGENGLMLEDVDGQQEGEEFVTRFWAAYDALGNVSALMDALPLTIELHRAIHRTGTGLLAKRQIRHLRAFRMGVVKDGPDVPVFNHPGALTKLALWLAEAIQEQEKDAGRGGIGKKRTPLVLASLNERRGVYVVVGTGGGGGVVDMEERRLRRERMEAKKAQRQEKAREKERKREERAAAKAQRRAEREEKGEEEDDDLDELETESEASEDEDADDDEMEPDGIKPRSNRFGVAFQEVVDEVGATTRIDNFENCVIEVKKEDLSSFLEALSMKAVVG